MVVGAKGEGGMAGRVNITHVTALILRALANGYRYGFDIMSATGLPSGTVYPALRRLENAGFVESSWEDADIAHGENRPPRKHYDITAEGVDAMTEAMRRYKTIEQLLPPAPGREGASEG